MRYPMRITAGALALAVGLTGAAHAEPFNIFSASKVQQANEQGTLEQVRHRYRHHRRGFDPGAAMALGVMGTIGAIAASRANRRYYCDPYYDYCGPRRVYRRHYYGNPYYYAPRRHYYYD